MERRIKPGDTVIYTGCNDDYGLQPGRRYLVTSVANPRGGLQLLDLKNHDEFYYTDGDFQKVVAETESGGTKHDQDKTRMDLLPLDVLEGVSQVLGFGAAKYGDYNFAQGMKFSRLLGACLRHLTKWQRGQDQDEESGLNHLDHAICSLIFLRYYQLYGVGDDDRHKKAQDPA